MSKDTPDKTDLSSMSKEELIAYLLKKNESLESQLKQQKEEAQKKEQASVASVSSIVSNLRAELSYKDALLKETLEDQEKLNQEKQQLLDEKQQFDKERKELTEDKLRLCNEKQKLSDEKQKLSDEKQKLSDEKQELIEDKVKLKETITRLKNFKQNASDLIRNVVDNIKRFYFVFKEQGLKENIPEFDEYNILEMNMFLEDKITTLLNAAKTCLEHEKAALNEPRSESTKHSKGNKSQDNSADITAGVDGAHELENAVTVEIQNNDQSDFDEAASSVTLKADTSATNTDKGEELTKTEIQDAVLSGCSSQERLSIEQNLSKGTKVLSLNIKNDLSSVNDSNRKRKIEHFITINDSEQIAGVICNEQEIHFRTYCDDCGEVMDFVLNTKAKRINTVLTASGSLANIKTILSKVHIANCKKCGKEIEINPATLSDFKVVKDNQNERWALNEREINEQETVQTALESVFSNSDDQAPTKEKSNDKRKSYKQEDKQRQLNRKDIYNSIVKSEDTHEISCNLKHDLIDAGVGLLPVINPYTFDAEAFGTTPAFKKSVMSVSLLSSCGTLFTQLGAPKNRIFNFYEGNGLPLTREQLTGGINAFARAFLHNVATNIHDDILNNSKAVVCDESTLLCREISHKKKANNGTSKSQIWVMTSSFTSPVKAAWYTVSKSRTAQNVVDILKEGVKKDCLLRYVISDGYSGYDCGIKTLEEITGCKLYSARCWTHGRRALFKLLQNTWLLRIYENELLPAGESFCNFEQNLKNYRASKAGKNLTDNDAALLTIFYLINSLFVIDSEVIRAHKFVCDTEEFKQDLLKARQQKSAKIVDLIFDSIRRYIADNPEIMSVKKTKQGEYRFFRNRKYPESGALIYLLKFEKALKEFTCSPDVELSSSAAERALKLGICTRHACMFIQSEDGAHAFADYQTIVNTCNLNRVPVQPYLMWLTANIRLRLLELQEQGRDDSTFFRMPHRNPSKDKDGNVIGILDMYDKSNVYCYDKIVTKGLAPYDYRRYLQSLQNS